MKYKLLVLDIDGTLNNSNKEISKITKRVLIKAQEKGLKIALASGRPTCGIIPSAKELMLDKFGGYILSFNGGVITNFATNEVIYEKVISKEDFKRIYDVSKSVNANILTYADGGVIAESLDEFLKIECRINKIDYHIVPDLVAHLQHNVAKFLMVGEGEYMGSVEPIVKEKLGDNFNVFRSEPFFLEIMPKNIDKAYSLGKLLEHIGLTRDEMIACGDGFNDISMISYAGMGVAMENAQPAVKEVSDYITLSNDNDGIAHVVEKFIFEEITA